MNKALREHLEKILYEADYLTADGGSVIEVDSTVIKIISLITTREEQLVEVLKKNKGKLTTKGDCFACQSAIQLIREGEE